MSHALFPVPPARAGSGRCPDELLVALLALNEEMVEQLHLERLSDAGTAGFLTRMIEQHEKAARLLRAHLAKSPATPRLSRAARG